MPSTVFFTDLRADLKRGLLDKIDELIKMVGLPERTGNKALTAIKLHFGEKGNTAFIRPVYVRRFVDAVQAAGGMPFLTDCNTLYVGSRAETVSHLNTAIGNGFAPSVVGAPLVIADGLKGQSAIEVPVNTSECQVAHIGADIVEADAIIGLAHFKGHELTGFGGALKNLGMGCGSRQGKLYMHSDVSPKVVTKKCVACGMCIRRCPVGAIKLTKRREDQPAPQHSKNPAYVALKDEDKCIGCADCILTCPEQAMQISWDAQVPTVMRRMTSYAKAVLMGKEEHSVFFNFITQVSPACDCYPYQDAPIVADVGICASIDPVALDQACADLVNQAPGSPASCLKSAHAPGEDKFRDVHPKVDWELQLAYGEEIGLGSRAYTLVTI